MESTLPYHLHQLLFFASATGLVAYIFSLNKKGISQ